MSADRLPSALDDLAVEMRAVFARGDENEVAALKTEAWEEDFFRRRAPS